MIVFNRFYNSDTVGLSRYLHEEVLKGNHITYISNTFLWFKKKPPKNIYYEILPQGIHPIFKVPYDTVNSTSIYSVYKFEEELYIEKEKKKPILDNTVLILFFLVVIAFIINGVSISYFYLANFFLLFGISLTIFLIAFEIPFRLYQRHINKKISINKQLHKGYLDIIIHSLRIIAAAFVFIVSFGISWPLFVLCITTMISLLISIKYRNAYWAITLLVLAWAIYLPVYDTKPLESIQKESPKYENHVYRSTLFVPVYEEYSGVSFTSHTPSFVYYKTANDWVFDELLVYIDKTGIYGYNGINQSIDVEGFVRCGKYNDDTHYYFETKDQILLVHYEGDEEQIINFAKLKMGVRGDNDV